MFKPGDYLVCIESEEDDNLVKILSLEKGSAQALATKAEIFNIDTNQTYTLSLFMLINTWRLATPIDIIKWKKKKSTT